MMLRNRIIENSDDDNHSTYVKCDCGTEILEFNYYHNDYTLIYDNVKKDVVCTPDTSDSYCLCFYGQLKRRDQKYGYNNFYFKDKRQTISFVDYLTNKEIETCAFLDSLPSNVSKKHGAGGIKIKKDDNFIYIQKYRSLEHKEKKMSWEIVMRYNIASQFAKEIQNIIGKEVN